MTMSHFDSEKKRKRKVEWQRFTTLTVGQVQSHFNCQAKNWNGKERQQKRPEIIREDFNQATRRYLSKI